MSGKKLFDDIEDWTKIGLENSKFILEEARTYVSYLAEVGDKITSKAFTILTFVIPIESALMAFIVNEKINKKVQDIVVTDLFSPP